MTNYIWITTQLAMTHNYPDAPKDVAFLRLQHRHLFKFKVYIEVKHDNRDVEFIMFKEWVEETLHEIHNNLEIHKSCEMISNELAKHIKDEYPNRKIKIEVSEDGENGVEFEYNQ